MSQHSVPYGDERIRFNLRRQPWRTHNRVAIHVEPDGCVLVDAPSDASLEQVKTAVIKRARWIGGHVNAAKNRRAQMLPREYVSGESLLYLGRRYRLKVLAARNTVPAAAMRGPFVEVRLATRDPQAVRKVLEDWYRERAKALLPQRLAAVAAPLRWVCEMPPMRLQTMARQWGSCSPGGRITLNPALVKAPRECIDYVLLHELCHLKHHNHSPKFYRMLDQQMPGWHCVKDRLDSLSEQLLNP
jgi:predicted metal-dependent hydrolase